MQKNSHQPQTIIPVDSMKGKELFLQVYVKDQDDIQLVCLPISYHRLRSLLADLEQSPPPTSLPIPSSIPSSQQLDTVQVRYKNNILHPIRVSETEETQTKIRPKEKIKINDHSDNHLDDYVGKAMKTFLKKCCYENPSGYVSRNDLQKAYQAWSVNKGELSIGGNLMADYLDKFYKTTKIKKKIHYTGLSLRD
jgi:hypothetical protein